MATVHYTLVVLIDHGRITVAEAGVAAGAIELLAQPMRHSATRRGLRPPPNKLAQAGSSTTFRGRTKHCSQFVGVTDLSIGQ